MSKTNVVKFETLKRQEIRKTIANGDSPIYIYNPSPEKKQQIEKMIFNKLQGQETSKDVELSAREVLLELLPILSNIDLGLDIEKDKEMIEEIINDPSDILVEVIDDISEIFTGISKSLMKNISAISKLPKEQLEKIMKENKVETPEEKRIRELKEELAKLESNKEIKEVE